MDTRGENWERVKYLLITEGNYGVQYESSVVNKTFEFRNGNEINRNTADSTVQLQKYLVEPKQTV